MPHPILKGAARRFFALFLQNKIYFQLFFILCKKITRKMSKNHLIFFQNAKIGLDLDR